MLIKEMQYMLLKHYTSWKRLNKKLASGCIMLRPTNRTIAKYMGICERQVAYYLNRLKEEQQDLEE
jgi:hypothetical protein